jgi:hypothetical protein
MEEQVYRQMLKRRALERWENEGGSVDHTEGTAEAGLINEPPREAISCPPATPSGD